MGGAAPARLTGVIMTMVVLVIVTTQAAASPGAEKKANHDSAPQVIAELAVYDPQSGNVEFTVEFDQRPDFRSVDEFGRPADSFQYFIVGDETLGYPDRFDAIIRGVELELKSRLLPIRAATPPDPAPEAGGWGATRAIAPYELHGRTLTFSVALDDLTDHSTDGRFTYILETYRYGTLVTSIESESVVPG